MALIQIRYAKDNSRAVLVSHIRTWDRPPAETSAPTFANMVRVLFDTHRSVDRVAMVWTGRYCMFLIRRSDGFWFDTDGEQVVTAREFDPSARSAGEAPASSTPLADAQNKEGV